MSEKTVEQIDAEIQKLQDARAEVVRLNEAKKPRHGDYGFDDEGDSCFMTADWDNVVRYCGNVSMSNPDPSVPKYRKIAKIVGNIFDDLKAAGTDGILMPLTREEAEYFAGLSTPLGLLGHGHARTAHERLKAKLK